MTTADDATETEWLPIGEGLAPMGWELAPQRVEPEANPTYGFQLLVPQKWIPDRIDEANRPVDANRRTPLAGWHAPVGEGEPAVVFIVEAMGVLRAIRAAHLLRHQAQLSGEKIMVVRELSPYFVDTLLRHEIAGQPFASRSAMWLAGDRAFVATGVAHADAFEQLNPVFGSMIASLQIEQRPASPETESRTAYRLCDRVEFDVPGSFVPLPLRSEGGRQALDLVQRSPNRELTGLLTVDLEPMDSIPDINDELRTLVAQLMARGVQFSDEPKHLEVSSGDSPFELRSSMWADVRSSGSKVAQEVWMSFISVDGASLRVAALGPARAAYFGDWAVLQRGYAILLESLRPA